MKKKIIKAATLMAACLLGIPSAFWLPGCSPPEGESPVSDDTIGYEDLDDETEDSIDMPNYGEHGYVDLPENTDTGTPMQASYEGCNNYIRTVGAPDPLNQPCNFRLMDQDGNLVELYDYEGHVILLDFSTVWCYWCKVAAEYTQTTHDKDPSLTVLTVLLQDNDGGTVEIHETQAWANFFGISSPVLIGNDAMRGAANDQWNVTSYPSFFFIDKSFHIRKLFPGWNQEYISDYLDNLLAE